MFNATVGDANANSFCTEAFANDYWASRLYGAKWLAASQTEREQALQQATSVLDPLDWRGTRASAAQALRWPRLGACDQDGYLLTAIDVPRQIKQATAQLAGELLTEDRTADAGMVNLNQLKVGPIQMTFDDKSRLNGLSPIVKSLITPLLRTNQSRVVRV